MKTRIEKDSLIEIITKNREQHQQIFEEAVEGYRRIAQQRFEEEIDRIKSGSLERVYVSLPAPVNHMNDYDRALKMIDLNIEETIVLDEQDAAQYIMDDWGWKGAFLADNASYSMTAAAAIS